MEISEVRVKLVEKSSERLRAFCSITLDGDFVVRDLKIIDGANGAFVAMPSRKLSDHCPRCGCKNHLRAKYCNECGNKLNESRAPKDTQGRAKLHADVAHPINAACRERIQNAVIEAFDTELEKAKSPDYQPPKYDDDYNGDLEEPLDADGDVGKPVKSSSSQARSETKGDDGFSDYDSLIADLKREAVSRRKKNDPATRTTGFTIDESAGNQAKQEIESSGPEQSEKKDNQPRKTEKTPVPAQTPSTHEPPAEQTPPGDDEDFGAGIW